MLEPYLRRLIKAWDDYEGGAHGVDWVDLSTNRDLSGNSPQGGENAVFIGEQGIKNASKKGLFCE